MSGVEYWPASKEVSEGYLFHNNPSETIMLRLARYLIPKRHYSSSISSDSIIPFQYGTIHRDSIAANAVNEDGHFVLPRVRRFFRLYPLTSASNVVFKGLMC
jgi:hypothetical protein